MASSGPSPCSGGSWCPCFFRDVAVRSPGFEPADYVALSFAPRVLLLLQPEILFPQAFQLCLVSRVLLRWLVLRRGGGLLSARAGK